MFPRGRSSVFDYKLCVPEGDNSVKGGEVEALCKVGKEVLCCFVCTK